MAIKSEVPIPLCCSLSRWIDLDSQARCFLNFKSKFLWEPLVKLKSINNLWWIGVFS